MSRFAGKNVVITGGSSGIGLGTAKYLTDGGARVMVTGRDQAGLDRAGESIGAIAVRSDMTSAADRQALAERVAAEFGSLDLLFVNAGVTRSSTFAETGEELYDEVFAINTRGVYFTVQALAPLMREGSGIVLTTSLADEMGMPGTGVYSASKAAVRSMARTFAAELLPRGVRVNAISPGPIDTGIIHRSMPAEAADAFMRQVREGNPMRRTGTEEEIARAVAFLGFEATYNTGLELAVDGGAAQL
ncbi:SDR family oxidoreductase [Kineosporia succinea]|uniref:NAD(P)-dependent dehydrogenase (Short-subunit alcohol dehydrogenase family) n=1 Tax=Kineosporia succinea TaxID=84632 RepID=A0ABT9PDQ4_9ACTN|nr:SDR family oxidoreductase [Kineosporia succinea]MDP9830612.1 NAD(P)-dependent dehydrogenase (short-subunit alcohol dehydrogenase family) [Kineosporia succinea]